MSLLFQGFMKPTAPLKARLSWPLTCDLGLIISHIYYTMMIYYAWHDLLLIKTIIYVYLMSKPRSWRSWKLFQYLYEAEDLYLTYIMMHEILHFVNGSDSTSVECPFLDREVPGSDTARCLFLGSMHKNANSFFIN